MKPLPKIDPPNPDAVVLGFGGDFERLDGYFAGWIFMGDGWFQHSLLEGNASREIYAAPRDSEIARLNAKLSEPSEAERLPKPDKEGWWWAWWGGEWNARKVIKKGGHLYLTWPDGSLVGVQRIGQPRMMENSQWIYLPTPTPDQPTR